MNKVSSFAKSKGHDIHCHSKNALPVKLILRILFRLRWLISRHVVFVYKLLKMALDKQAMTINYNQSSGK